MTTAGVALECIGLAALLYAACFAVGWWLWRLTTHRTRALSVWAGAPIAGLAVSMTVGYYWASHGGLDVIAPWLLAGAIAADLAVYLSTRSRAAFDRGSARRLLWSLAVVASTTVLFCWHHLRILRLGRLSTGSLFLADLPSFAFMGAHLGRAGLEGPGNIVGYSVPALAAQTPGSAMFMSFASSWSGRVHFEATLPAALVCVVLIALVAHDLACVIIPWSRALPAALGVLAAGVSILVYSVSHYPLSQLLAAPCAMAFLVIVADVAMWERSRELARRAACAAVCFAPIVLAYPHMAVLAPPLLLAVALSAAIGHGWRQRLTKAALVGLGALVLAAVVLPAPLIFAFDRVRQVEEQVAGFTLTLLTPADLLGFRSAYRAYGTEPNLVAQFAFEAAAIGAIAMLVLLLTRGKSRARSTFAAVAALGTLASYAAVFLVRGASYEQWKWAAFVVPIFVIGTGSTLVLALAASTRRLGHASRRLAFGLLAGAVLAGVVSGGVFAQDATERFVAEPDGTLVEKEWSLVTDDLRTMGAGPAFQGVHAVNVEVPSYWESSWAAYFLAPRSTFLASPEGVVTVAPGARWTLERNDALFLHPPSSDVRVVNATYRLVRERPDREQPGSEWIVGACAGRYRFDGKRWQGIERTPATGGYELNVTPEARSPHTRVPLLVRNSRNAVDALLLEYLPGARARIVGEHIVKVAITPDPRLRTPPESTSGREFEMKPGDSFSLSAVFDPITGDVRAERNGEILLASRSTFLVAALFGEAVVGVNETGATVAEPQFSGRLDVVPQTPTRCDTMQADTQDVVTKAALP